MKRFKLILRGGGSFHVWADNYGKEIGQGYTLLVFTRSHQHDPSACIPTDLVDSVIEESEP